MAHETDFIDTDLQAPRVPRPDPRMEEREEAAALEQLTRQRARLEDEVSGTARELESLRQQQENLLKRKQTLESLRERQGRYVEEKRDLAKRIQQSLLLLETEETRVEQLRELYRDSRAVFDRLEAQLHDLEEGGWSEENLDRELAHALDVLKSVRMEFKKSLIRLDAMDWTREGEESSDLEETVGGGEGFGYWLKVGVALALPFAVFGVISALIVVWVLTTRGGTP